MKTSELRAAYLKAKELTGSSEGMTYLGMLFEAYHDIKIYMDDKGELWYSSYYVGD